MSLTDEMGERLHAHAAALFPICRSITGEGLRRTLAYIGRHVPLAATEVPSGTEVLDWTVPLEWTHGPPLSAALRARWY